MYVHPTEITVKFTFLHISLKPPVTKNNKSQKKVEEEEGGERKE